MTSRPLPQEIAAISYEIADSLEPEMREAFLAVIDAVAQAVPLDQLRSLLESRDFASIYREYQLALGSVLRAGSVDEFVNVHRRVFQASLRTALISATVVPLFQNAATSTLVRLEAHARGLFLDGVSRDAIDSVATILTSGIAEGLGAQQVARLIRPSLALQPRHTRAVVRHYYSMLERGVDADEAARVAELYAGRLRALRATTIARTEVIHASMEAQVALWQQMVDEGLLINERTWMEWRVTEDDALCEYCAPMDGQRRRVYDTFLSTHKGYPDGRPKAKSTLPERKTPLKPDPRGSPRRILPSRRVGGQKPRPLGYSKAVLHPPLHPNCRCTLSLVFE